MQTVHIDTLIQQIVREVVAELEKQGIQIVQGSLQSKLSASFVPPVKTETIDMSQYKTPVLTVSRLQRLHVLTGTIRIPKGTVITPKARQYIQEKQFKVDYVI